MVDSLAIQEHVRRALDLYLDVLDRKREKELMQLPSELLKASPQGSTMMQPQAPPKQKSEKKLAYR